MDLNIAEIAWKWSTNDTNTCGQGFSTAALGYCKVNDISGCLIIIYKSIELVNESLANAHINSLMVQV